ncbi:Polyphosphate kinase, partial [human gut metagenome]
DWMSRNLDRRVEVCTPILDRQIQRLLREVFAIQWSDNVKARDLADQADNPHLKPAPGQCPVRSQTALYDYYEEQSEKEKNEKEK